MSFAAIGIRAWGAIAPPPCGRLPEDLEPISSPLVGRRFRKIGRFIKLVLSGAATAVRASGLQLVPDRTGVFFGTGIGNSPDLAEFAEAVLGGPTEAIPSPVQFAHSVGNAGAFYVAQAFELTGPVVALSQEDVSFECALLAARDLLSAGDVDVALVGGADVYHPDDAAQRTRMGLPDSLDVPLSEGSGWLVLERAASTSRAILGEIRVELAEPLQALRRHLAEPAQPCSLSVSARLSPQLTALAALIPGAKVLPPRGAFPTECAVALCAWLDEPAAPPLFHSITATRDGYTGLVSVRRGGP